MQVLIRTGAEGFELDVGAWSHLGNKALTTEQYAPDFDAAAVPPYRLLRIHRASYLAALDASRLEQVWLVLHVLCVALFCCGGVCLMLRSSSV